MTHSWADSIPLLRVRLSIESNPDTQDGKNMSGLAGWRSVYLLAAGLVISSAVSFLIFGEARVQDWNYPDENIAEEGGKEKGQKVAVVSIKAITDCNTKFWMLAQ